MRTATLVNVPDSPRADEPTEVEPPGEETGTSTEATPSNEEATQPNFQNSLHLTQVQRTHLETKPSGVEVLAIHDMLTEADLEQANTKAIDVFQTLKAKYTPLQTSNRQVNRPGGRSNTRRRASNTPNLPPSRVNRRDLYKMVQTRWKSKRRSKVIETIINGSLGAEPNQSHTSGELGVFWKEIFEKESLPDTRAVEDPRLGGLVLTKYRKH